MTSALGAFFGLDRAAVTHALRLAFAAWLAFAIASLLHVGNAYWAAMPIWVVSQTAKGLLLERAAFRVVGTLLGAAAGFAILYAGGDPVLILALLGAWVAVNASLVHLLRGVHGYGALMAGMTAAVVVLPSVLRPEHAVDVALARVECTLIGVVVVTLVTGFWTPQAPREEFYRRVRRLTQEVVAFAASDPDGEDPASERRILEEMAAIQANAALVTAGSIEGYRRLHHVHALIVAALGAMAAAVAVGQRRRRADSTAECREPDPRLADALDRLARADKAFDSEPDKADPSSFGSKASYLAPHHDARIAIETGLLAGAATFAAGFLGYVSGWPVGELAALGVCIFSMVLGSLPRAAAPIVMRGVSAGVAAALLYRLTIQPHVATVPQLVLSVAPFILVGAFARASQKTAAPALDANMCFLLASQAVLPAVTDRAVILNEAAALMLGAGLVTSGVMMLPPGTGRRATRAADAIVADLLRMTRAQVVVDQPHGTAGAARRILRLSLHLERAAIHGARPGWSLVGALNLGEAINRIQIRLARPDTDETVRRGLMDALAALRRMAQDPTGTAGRLDGLARAIPDTDAAEALWDAADALRASRGIIMYGGGTPPSAAPADPPA